jgi:pyridoxal phosphate enzyme (YggS family)
MELLALGHTLFGENRVQEALAKQAEVGPGARWHLVGRLQRNKARQAVGAFELIHAVDGEELARELGRRAGAARLRQRVLLQVNVAGEATKAGVDPQALPRLVDAVAAMPSLALEGLTAIPPPQEDPERSRPWFSRLRELRDRCQARAGAPLPELSMGMSGDYAVAVEEGATLVRVGTALFGLRSWP